MKRKHNRHRSAQRRSAPRAAQGNKVRYSFELVIDGKKRGFVYSKKTIKRLELLTELPFEEITKRLQANGPKLGLLIRTLYAAALQYNDDHKIKPDFSIQDCAEWMKHDGGKWVLPQMQALSFRSQIRPRSGIDTN